MHFLNRYWLQKAPGNGGFLLWENRLKVYGLRLTTGGMLPGIGGDGSGDIGGVGNSCNVKGQKSKVEGFKRKEIFEVLRTAF